MSPPVPGPSATAPARPFDVLVVGTMNLCRSPAAERLLRARFGEDVGVTVTSVGIDAAIGEPVPEPLVELAAGADTTVDDHTPAQLDADMVRSADLVLTTTREERAAVVSAVPTALRRTFTLRELARMARFLDAPPPGGTPPQRIAELVEAAAERRGFTAPAVVTDDDVLDPYGQDEAAYATAFEQVSTAVADIAQFVTPDPSAVLEAPAPTPHYPPPVRPGRSRSRTVALVVLASVLVLVIALTAGAMVMVDRLDSRIKRFPDPFAGLPTRPPVVTPAPSESGAVPAEHAVTVLVLGSTDDVAVAGPDGWAAAAALTDVVLLAHVSADRRSAQVIAMPPDLWVDVPGSGPGALRSALALGGPPRAVQTVEQLTDVRVDHVALTDAATFARVTEALGGVDLDVANDVVVRGRLLIRAGHRHLSGEQTLLWVQGGGDGDSGRAKREEAWLRAILNRVGEADVRQDPTRWLQLLSVVSGSVAVDEGLDRSTLVGLLASMRGLQPADVDVVVAPTTTGTSADGQPVLVPDSAPFAALMDALRTDTLSQHLAAAGASG